MNEIEIIISKVTRKIKLDSQPEILRFVEPLEKTSHFYVRRTPRENIPFFFGHPLRSHWGVISRKFAHKVAKSKYFEKFKLNRNLQTIPFNMMYNMSMLRHWFSNERWGGGRPELPSSLIL